MALNTAAGGLAEHKLRTLLRARLPGVRLAANVRTLAGKPDLVIASARVCVFCDGDFWHGRRWGTLRSALERRSNAAYWVAKIESNRARDRTQTRALQRAGWVVVRVWETDVLNHPERQIARILRHVRQ